MTPEERVQKIRELNDRLRVEGKGGRILITGELGQMVKDNIAAQAFLVQAVRSFDLWDDGNDPYREHDFGSFDLNGKGVFFKIDYLDLAEEEASPDPTDPKRTVRVMTIAYLSDY